MYKGQSHFLIIIGILIFVLVVIVFATQSNLIFPTDAGSLELKKALAAEMENKIRNQALDTIQKIGKRGGYLESPQLSTEFSGEQVPYWQVCQKPIIPPLDTIKQNIKNDLQTKLNSNKASEFQGKGVVVSDVQNIEVVTRPDDTILRIWMPTRIENIELDQPYQIIVPLELGKAYDFASSFISDNSKNRHLSKFIASLLYHSYDRYLPTVGLLTKCGDNIILTYDQAKERVQNILNFATLNIRFWQQQPTNTDYLSYYIPNIGGKTFEDLEISFRQTDSLDKNTFQSSMNPIVIVNSRNLYKVLPYCTKGYDIRYNIRPSFVASVKTKNNFEFNFGVMPFVKNSRVGLCSGVEDLVNIADTCSQAKCDAKVLVEGPNGSPVPGTKVLFSSCSLGKTNEQGIAEGKVPCSISQLSAFNQEYLPFYDIKSSLDLKDTKITLRKGPPITIHFSKAFVETQATSIFGVTKIDGYKITIDNSPTEHIFTEVIQREGSPWNTFETIITNNNPDTGLTESIMIDFLPTGKYEFTVNSFKSLRLYKKFCTHRKWYDNSCDRYETIDQNIIVPTKITREFEIKENTTDIYLTAFYPAKSQVGEAPDQYDYGDGAIFSQCILSVSEIEQKLCEIKL